LEKPVEGADQVTRGETLSDDTVHQLKITGWGDLVHKALKTGCFPFIFRFGYSYCSLRLVPEKSN